MTSTFTPNINLEQQGVGDNANSWGVTLNQNVIGRIDSALGSKLVKSVAGSSNVTLTSTEAGNLYYTFTGTLTGNIAVIWPANAGRLIIVNNATAGSFALTVQQAGGTGLGIPQGVTKLVLLDGTSNIASDALNALGAVTISGLATHTAAVNFAKGSDVASGTTTNIGAATGNYVNITGTVTIAGFDTVQAGTTRLVNFTGILTLTYDATKLILPGKQNLTTAPGDIALFVSLGSGNWVCAFYQPASGFSTNNPVFTGTVTAGSFTPNSTSGIIGTTTNNDAAPGSVGEYTTSNIPIGSAVALTNTTSANITSINLTAGDWDVWANAWTNPGSGTITASIEASISTSSGNLSTPPDNGGHAILYPYLSANTVSSVSMMKRISVAVTTPVYLVANVAFGGGTLGGYGSLQARRVR